jgi:hypothetical protein
MHDGVWLGLARTIYIQYIWCVYSIFGRDIIKQTMYVYGSGQAYVWSCVAFLDVHTMAMVLTTPWTQSFIRGRAGLQKRQSLLP